MRDSDWKIWILILCLGVGGMLELFKHFPGSKAQAIAIELDPFGILPYNVKKAERLEKGADSKRPSQAAAMARVNAKDLEAFVAANAPAATDFEHKEKGAEGKAKKVAKKKNEEWEYFIDPKTGKMYRRKKGSKKTKQAEPTEEIVEYVPDEPKREDNSTPRTDNYVSQTYAPPQPPAPAEEPRVDLNGWIARLLSHPDLEETNRFIEQYRAGKVSADIFYKIVAMMIEDVRPQMKALGVHAAGMTPSVMSFQHLAAVVATVPTTDALRVSADAFVLRYTEIGNLYILERILRAPNSSYATVLAAQMLEHAAERYLSAEQNQPPSGDPRPGEAAPHSNAAYFERFLTILDNLTHSTDQEVAQRASRTLTNLRQLLGNPPVAGGEGAPAQASTDPDFFQ